MCHFKVLYLLTRLLLDGVIRIEGKMLHLYAEGGIRPGRDATLARKVRRGGRGVAGNLSE
jgi:hypothetical protein